MPRPFDESAYALQAGYATREQIERALGDLFAAGVVGCSDTRPEVFGVSAGGDREAKARRIAAIESERRFADLCDRADRHIGSLTSIRSGADFHH